MIEMVKTLHTFTNDKLYFMGDTFGLKFLTTYSEFITNLLFFFLIFLILQKVALFVLGFTSTNIKVTSEFRKSKNKNLGMAITVKEIENYLNEVKKTNPFCLTGIRKVILSKPHPSKHLVLGSYVPSKKFTKRKTMPMTIFRQSKTGIIRIYPLPKNINDGGYYIPLASGFAKVVFTEEEAKSAQLFTLGHEIGHSVLYRKGHLLHGSIIEQKCDDFSKQLELVPELNELGKYCSV